MNLGALGDHELEAHHIPAYVSDKNEEHGIELS
jgi:hypothetical protein